MKKRLFATAIALCMIVSLFPASAMAIEPEVLSEGGSEVVVVEEQPEVAEPEECTCKTLCTAGEVDIACPVCSAEGAVLAEACKGQQPAFTTEEPEVDVPVAPTEECNCETPCTEDAAKQDCPVCGAEGAVLAEVCKGKQPEVEEPVAPTEECNCETLCTEDNVKQDCPVCGAEGANLEDCKGEEPVVAVPVPQAGNVYVSDGGNDSTGEGTVTNPYASLKKAVDEAEDGATIYVMTDLTITERARIVDKHITITSAPADEGEEQETYTITRDPNFAATQDAARSTYNPALIEVTVPGGKGASLTLENIILDDNGEHGGEYFLQASSLGNYEVTFSSKYSNNRDTYTATYQDSELVQDSMIAAYGTNAAKVEIKLNQGAVLKNYGGMSAVRLEANSTLTMNSGSVIQDDIEKVKTGVWPAAERAELQGNPKITARTDYGAAGAVWIQGGTFIMKNDARICGMEGRAVYADGENSSATIYGSINGITGNADMWERTDGIALHLRNKSEATLFGRVENCSNGALVITNEGEFTMEAGSLLGNSNAAGIKTNEDPPAGSPPFGNDRNKITINGEITGIKGNNTPIQFKYGELTIDEKANIHDNEVFFGALYVQRDATVHVLGDIHDNTANSHGGGIATAGHGRVTINMYSTASVTNNQAKDSGGGLYLKACDFNMYGGTISENSALNGGGGIHVCADSHFVMFDGTITANTSGTTEDSSASGIGGGILYTGETPSTSVELKSGIISGNVMNATASLDEETGKYKFNDGVSNDISLVKGYKQWDNTEKKNKWVFYYGNQDRYMTISDQMEIGNNDIYLDTYPGATLTAPGTGIKFGGASSDVLKIIVEQAQDSGFLAAEAPSVDYDAGTLPGLASLWFESDGRAVDLEFNIDESVTAYNSNLPVYAAIVQTGVEGTYDGGTVGYLPVAKTAEGKLQVSIPANIQSDGFVIMLFQPAEDYGNLTLSAPEQVYIRNNSGVEIPYTATYTISDAMLARMTEGEDLTNVTIEIQFSGDVAILDEIQFTSQVFEMDGSYTYDNGKLTIPCTLKSGWESATSKETTITFNAGYNGSETTLFATGVLTAELKDAPVNVPANTVSTVVTNLTDKVVVTPVDMTIYTGGNSYTGAVDGNGDGLKGKHGLPEPAFYVTLPADVEEELKDEVNYAGTGPLDLTKYVTITAEAQNGDTRSWTLKHYTEGGNSTITVNGKTYYIYGLEPAGGQEEVRMLFKDEQGDVVKSDDFSIALDTLYHEYEMSIYTNTVDTDSVKATIAIPQTRTIPCECSVVATTGTLTVRGLVDEEFADITTTAPAAGGSDIVAVAEDQNEYYVNGNQEVVVDAKDVDLLVDDVVDSAKATLNSKLASMGYDTSNVIYKYFDLVDTSNGNAWITSAKPMTIYLPYSGNISSNTKIHVIHFDGLDRNYKNLNDKLSEKDPKKLNAVYQDGYIVFQTTSFSPFALIVEDNSGTVNPNPGGGGTSTSDDYTLHYVTNGGEKLSSETKSHSWTKDYEDLPTPERDGYTFVGWYWDLRLTDPVRDDIKIDKSTVDIYAKWEKDGTWTGSGDVSAWLDTVNHKAFLSGYPDGTFGTDRNMTRAEVAQMFYSLLLDKDVKITKTFTDVPADAWYAKAVNTLASLGMLGGYPDGTFQPNRTITRAEFAVVALAFTDGGSGASCSFTDVSRNDWFYKYAAQASEYGWIGGYPDGSFRPNNKITRAEVSVIVNNMLGRDADERFIDQNSGELVSFSDLTDGHWAYYAVMEATNSHKHSVNNGNESWDRLVTGV